MTLDEAEAVFDDLQMDYFPLKSKVQDFKRNLRTSIQMAQVAGDSQLESDLEEIFEVTDRYLKFSEYE